MTILKQPSSILTNRKTCKICGKDDLVGEEWFSSVCNECKIKIDIKRHYEQMVQSLPVKYRNIIDRFDMEKQAKEICDKSLYLYGKTGTGKTALATFILKELWSLGKKGKFISFPGFVMWLQGNIEMSYEEIKDNAKYDGCLIIDDFGAERLTDYVRSVIYYMINTREQNELQTIITSNYPIKEINHKVDDRIASRISGMCEVIEMQGKDKRIKT